MISPNEPTVGKQIAGTAPSIAPSPKSATPVAGVWARLRSGSPWLDAFPMAWVPVHTLLPKKCEGATGDSAWDLDHRRCTDLQLKFLAGVLERARKGPAEIILEGLKLGNRVQIGAGHLAFVEDFTGKKRCAWHEFAIGGKGGK